MQIATGAIKVYVYNSQHITPDVQAQVQAAQANNIPIVVMTETPPAGSASWQQWQTTQLEGAERRTGEGHRTLTPGCRWPRLR